MNGKNFIPKAEEYIRKGLLDEAISLLKEGIDTYPGYLSARAVLGKAYIEKGMLDDARQEFEHVVKASPDNILAHKRLAVLYKDAGMTGHAIKSCEAVLVYNPGDREISDLLNALKSEREDKIHGHAANPIDFTSGWEVASEESGTGRMAEEFVTESMGDLCIAQGEKEKGIEIFRKILQREPDNESIKGKLMDLQQARLNDFLNKVRTNRK